MQRGPIALNHLGSFTRFQAAEMWGSKGDAKLVKLVENGQTLTRGSFATTETLGKFVAATRQIDTSSSLLRA
jgi:hypothetical protein